jgi:hypothetical protein
VADRQTLNAANIDLLNSVSSSTPWIWDWASALFAFRANNAGPSWECRCELTTSRVWMLRRLVKLRRLVIASPLPEQPVGCSIDISLVEMRSARFFRCLTAVPNQSACWTDISASAFELLSHCCALLCWPARRLWMLFYGTAVEYPLVFAHSSKNAHITGTGAEPKIVNAVCILPSIHRIGHDSLGLVCLVVHLAVVRIVRKAPALRTRRDFRNRRGHCPAADAHRGPRDTPCRKNSNEW